VASIEPGPPTWTATVEHVGERATPLPLRFGVDAGLRLDHVPVGMANGAFRSAAAALPFGSIETEGSMSDTWDAAPPPGVCPWCSAGNAPDARQCVSCGASIAQRDDLGGVTVPGVTGVDPNLLGTPRSLASPMLRSQGTLGAINAVGHVDPALGLVAAAAVLGQDTIKGLLGANRVDLETVGKPSEAALQAVERLERGDSPGVGVPSPRGAGPEPEGPTPEPPNPDPEGPMPEPPTPEPPSRELPDPWADLPARPG